MIFKSDILAVRAYVRTRLNEKNLALKNVAKSATLSYLSINLRVISTRELLCPFVSHQTLALNFLRFSLSYCILSLSISSSIPSYSYRYHSSFRWCRVQGVAKRREGGGLRERVVQPRRTRLDEMEESGIGRERERERERERGETEGKGTAEGE